MKRAFQQFVFASVMAGFGLAKKIPFLKAAMNRYEAAFQGWGERSWLFQDLKDAWLEIDAMTRKELQRIAESLIENSTIVQKIRSLKVQFSVGPTGLKIIPESSDEGFNDARSVSWEGWWARPELGSDISGAQLTRVWAGMLFDKGEIFIHKTEAMVAGRGPRVQKRKEPRLQTIDAHRVKTPSGFDKDPITKFPIIDGIVVNPVTGERVAYFVKKTNFSGFTAAGIVNQSDEEFDRLEAADVIHKFKVRRPGQLRGIPEGFSAFNLVRDNMDLHKLEMHAAKIACEIAVVENNPSGELDTYSSRKQKLNIQTQNAAGSVATKNTFGDYSVSFGAKKFALKTGDSLKNFQIDRPSIVQQQYWDLHYTLICMGYNVPKLLVMPYSLQGTVTRADLDVCASAFREEFELIREILEDVYQWQGEWALDYDTDFNGAAWMELTEKRAKSFFTAHKVLAAADVEKNHRAMSAARAKWLMRRANAHASDWVMDGAAPEDAHTCLIRPPRAPNVDIGYTAKALEIEMRLGIKPPQDVFADKNQDWRQQVWQMGEYVAYVKDVADQLGCDPGQLTSLIVQAETADDPDKAEEPEGSPEARLQREVTA